MKIFDERIQKEEIRDLSEELAEYLVQALDEDYNVLLVNDNQMFLQAEIQKVLSRFFNIKN
jgi:hypothetical protein